MGISENCYDTKDKGKILKASEEKTDYRQKEWDLECFQTFQ